MLHLDRIKEDCRQTVSSNTSLWARDGVEQFPQPPQDIVDFLCLNDCSGHGHCSAGETPRLPGPHWSSDWPRTVQVSVSVPRAGEEPTAVLTSVRGPGLPTSATTASATSGANRARVSSCRATTLLTITDWCATSKCLRWDNAVQNGLVCKTISKSMKEDQLETNGYRIVVSVLIYNDCVSPA